MRYRNRSISVPRRSAGGFTLAEILIALGIFAIGMIAVASLFPVAALLQRETAAEVISEHAANNAKAVIEAKGLTYTPPTSGLIGGGDLGRYHSLAGTTKTNAVPLAALAPVGINNLLISKLPADERSYPTSTPDPASRDLYWVPFVQNLNGDPNNTQWVLRLFLIEPNSTANYPGPNASANPMDIANPLDQNYFPKVVSIGCSVVDQTTFRLANAGHGLQGGDLIMDSNGTDYSIVEVDGANITILGRILLSPAQPRTIWFAPPYGSGSSPTQRIVTVKIDSAVK